MSHLITLNNSILAEILAVLTKMSEEEFTPDNEKILSVINSYEVETTFIDCIASVVRDWIAKNGRGLELFAMNPGVCNLIFQIIGVVGTNSRQCQQVFLSTVGIPRYDELVNKTKIKALEILNHILRFWVKYQLETRYISNNLMYMNYIILTLWYITEKVDYHEYLQEDEDARNMTIWLLENMIIWTRSRMFSDFFARVRARVIWDILLMLLTTSEKRTNWCSRRSKRIY